MKRYLTTVFLLAFVISACSAAQGESSESLIGSWQLSAYGAVGDPLPAVPDSGAQVIFNDDGTVGGNSGCNGFGGNYAVEGDQVTFSEIVSTLMACEDARMAQEDAVYQVLSGTSSFKIEGNTLTLENNGRTLVLTR